MENLRAEAASGRDWFVVTNPSRMFRSEQSATAAEYHRTGSMHSHFQHIEHTEAVALGDHKSEVHWWHILHVR